MPWIPMTEAHIPEVKVLADEIHKGYPEDAVIFAERRNLYPSGCFALISNGSLAGYMIAHPWKTGKPPKINALLRELPQKPDTFYLHDIAISAAARGQGAAAKGVSLIIANAKAEGFNTLSLTAVSGSTAFWQKQGFQFAAKPEEGMESYGSEARCMVLLLNRP